MNLLGPLICGKLSPGCEGKSQFFLFSYFFSVNSHNQRVVTKYGIGKRYLSVETSFHPSGKCFQHSTYTLLLSIFPK